MPHEHKLTLREPEDIFEELSSWWRDLAAGSALAALAIAGAVMLLI